jgi:hypothetical protein
MAIISTAQLVGVGGTAPYTFVAPQSDPKTSLPNGSFNIIGSTLSIDSTSLPSGTNTLHVIITDSALHTADTVLTILIVDPTLLTILNNSQNFEPSSFPSTQSIPLKGNGGLAPYTWSLISSVTTLPNVTIDSNNNLNFPFINYGTWTVGIKVVDTLGSTTSKVIQIAAVNSQVVTLVDGQIELLVNVPAAKAGINNFTLSVTDSAPTSLVNTFSYKSDPPISAIYLSPFAFDHYWGSSDSTTVILPVIGDLSGYRINTSTPTILDNGLTVTVDGTNNVVEVSGPPTGFQNNQTYVQLPILQGSTQVATITREYTLLSHNGTSDIGAVQCFTRPYIVGESVGLNPLKPWFNSPSISKSSTLFSRVQSGSTLPPGLSLDANSSLIYGNLVGTATSQSIIEYYDAQGVIHGTVTITWDTQQNSFSLIDNIVDGSVQQAFSATIGSSSSSTLTTVNVYRGRLPQGLSIAPNVSGTNITITGTPTESGYFDLWFRVTNSSAQSAYLYHRLVINYINPLVILTSSLPTAVTYQIYNGTGFTLQGYGGITPYTWSLDASSPALPTGMTLNAAGLLSGEPTSSSYNQNLVINLTDARGVTTSAVLNLAINNNVQITTTTLPKIIPGQSYSFKMSALGGITPYTWSQTGGLLPNGISFNTTTGVFSGVTNSAYSQSITIGVTDVVGGSGHTDSKTYLLQTGTSSMLVDTSGVGLVDRGAPYQGLLKAYGTFTSPNTWQVVPSSPNQLPTGLTLQANASDNGVTAYISGSSTTLLSSYTVLVQAVDSLGSSAQAFVVLNSTSSLAITTATLPVGTVTANYTAQVQATGYNPPFTYSLASGSLPSGYSLSSSGLITGVTGGTYNSSPTFQVTDSLGDTYPFATKAQAALNLVVQPSGLSITTTSINQVISGHSFSQTLTAAGGSGSYTWSISPSSSNQLPIGLSLGSSSGAITGTSTQTGYNLPVTFRVTDNTNGAYAEAQFTVTVISGLTLQTGIDYTDGISTNYLGYVSTGNTDSISPRPNYSFYVVATGVVTTNSATLSSGISISNSGFTASVESLNNGIAFIRVSGPFASGSLGDNSFGITVTDSGVSATGSFRWNVYVSGAIRASATNAFPQQIIESSSSSN